MPPLCIFAPLFARGAVSLLLAGFAALSASAATYQQVYSFTGNSGSNPRAGLIQVNGMLYGTTFSGGDAGDGTVFQFDPASGVESVLYSFLGMPDGYYPYASLTYTNSLLYGTTFYGGSAATIGGTIFTVDPSTGNEQVLYSFYSYTNGRDPDSSLTSANSLFYGTATNGGSCGEGTVFQFDPTSNTFEPQKE